jgi:hypothetical protein
MSKSIDFRNLDTKPLVDKLHIMLTDKKDNEYDTYIKNSKKLPNVILKKIKDQDYKANRAAFWFAARTIINGVPFEYDKEKHASSKNILNINARDILMEYSKDQKDKTDKYNKFVRDGLLKWIRLPENKSIIQKVHLNRSAVIDKYKELWSEESGPKIVKEQIKEVKKELEDVKESNVVTQILTVEERKKYIKIYEEILASVNKDMTICHYDEKKKEIAEKICGKDFARLTAMIDDLKEQIQKLNNEEHGNITVPKGRFETEINYTKQQHDEIIKDIKEYMKKNKSCYDDKDCVDDNKCTDYSCKAPEKKVEKEKGKEKGEKEMSSEDFLKQIEKAQIEVTPAQLKETTDYVIKCLGLKNAE